MPLNAELLERLLNLVLIFFIYSCLGWCMEVALKYRQFHRFINRGFFTGPILPIYGSGVALITVVVEWLAPFESGYGTTFAISFLLCGTVEYLASYYMEKRYHARWWDYSQKPMNLHGRVWIGNLVLFGLGGTAVVHLTNPLLYRLFAMVSLAAREDVAGALLAVFAAACVVTHFKMKLVKIGVESSEADNTEAISREVRLLLSDRSFFYKRFADAYPEVIYRTERINARMMAIRAETERLRQEAEQRYDAVSRRIVAGREQLAASLEPSGAIKSSVIRRQEALIGMLYREDDATDEMKALKRDIDADLTRLRARRGRT